MQHGRRKEVVSAGGQVPPSLIYELIDGRPIYFKGYREVLSGERTLEEIMGSSALQAEIIQYLLSICFDVFDLRAFRIYTNEIGSHLDKGNNLSNDIAIFDKEVLRADDVNVHYPKVPAKLVFEVDIDAETENWTEHEYVHTKIQKMLDFGVETVFWITSKTQKVLVAEAGKNWAIMDWGQDIALWEGRTFNIGRHLKEEGIELGKADSK